MCSFIFIGNIFPPPQKKSSKMTKLEVRCISTYVEYSSNYKLLFPQKCCCINKFSTSYVKRIPRNLSFWNFQDISNIFKSPIKNIKMNENKIFQISHFSYKVHILFSNKTDISRKIIFLHTCQNFLYTLATFIFTSL